MVVEEVDGAYNLDIKKNFLFAKVDQSRKTLSGKEVYNEEVLVPQRIRKKFSPIFLFAHVGLEAYGYQSKEGYGFSFREYSYLQQAFCNARASVNIICVKKTKLGLISTLCYSLIL